MIILDSSIVLVAVPSIELDLNFSAGGVAMGAERLRADVRRGCLLLGGRIADLLGRRRVFIAAWRCSAHHRCFCGSRGPVKRWCSPAGCRGWQPR